MNATADDTLSPLETMMSDTIWELCGSIPTQFLVIDPDNRNDDGTITEMRMGFRDIHAFFEDDGEEENRCGLMVALTKINDCDSYHVLTNGWMVKRIG